ncbi:MAG: MarR family transcriptional regulator, partial [Chloroflexi bacterium]|nr:MarR family transcriptional regulator [Chloroflexota bacterium]
MSKPSPFTQSLRSWMDIFMHRSMRGWMTFAKTTGLSMPQFSILMQLHHKGVCGMSEISERFDITNAAASQLAEKLVQSGYIERAEDPNDRRAKMLQLT